MRKYFKGYTLSTKNLSAPWNALAGDLRRLVVSWAIFPFTIGIREGRTGGLQLLQFLWELVYSGKKCLIIWETTLRRSGD